MTRRPVVWSAWGIAIALHIGALGALSIIDWPPAPGQSSRSVTFDVTLTQAPSTASQDESANAVAAPETPTPARQLAQSAISAKAPKAHEVQPSLKNEVSRPKAQQREEAKPKPERPVDRVTKPVPTQQASTMPQTQKSERSAVSSRAEKSEKKAAPSASDLLAQATSRARSNTFGLQPENDTRAPVNGAQRAAINRYIRAWTNSVERYGNQFHNGPANLSGTLRIRAVILRNGELASVEVIQSSGYPELDQTALSTVREAAPYRPFDSGMGDNRQRLVITRTWQFGQGNSFGVQ